MRHAGAGLDFSLRAATSRIRDRDPERARQSEATHENACHQRSRIIARKPPFDGHAAPVAPGKRRVRASKPPATLAEAAKITGTPRKKAAAAGPVPAVPGKRKPRGVHPVAHASLERLQQVIVTSLEDDKAEAILSLDLAGRASFADRMVIATGLADRQITAMATHLEEKLHQEGIKRVQIEGAGGSDWVLIDAGDIVVHLFKPEARSLYALEKMWGAELDEPVERSTAV